MEVLHYFGAAIGLGIIVVGAGLGIGRFAAAAADGIARQPEAADKITGAVNLPLFLLEGGAILAEVFVLLIVLIVQAYVFTILSALFIGMAIKVHH